MPTDQEGHRTKFYESYRKVAGEYDKEFIKRHDDDLTTTLIFMSRDHMEPLWTYVNQRDRLVCFLL